MQILQPPGWAKPRGFSNGIAARGTTIYVAGQVGWDPRQPTPDGRCGWPCLEFAGQARQALQNIVEVLTEAGGKPEHLVRLTWYVLNRDEYVAAWPAIGAAYRDIIGRHFPAMAAVGVTALVEPEARVEIEATAVIPD
ncbi:MAG: RidA family protein [Betaproteobacteria bacterium]|nr:RidA family protein [Betaproteobacteria bacterium]